MSKDPAFLFYSSDFLTGTMFFTDEQVGKYMRLLCAQHQTGHLTENAMLHVCKVKDEQIYAKFKQDENGLYYNERLEEESKKRNAYTESRRKNLDSVKEKPHMDTHMGAHMENENINTNINDNKGSKGGTGGKKGFVPPTLEDVKLYCTERDNGVDAKRFFEYYDTAGWKDRDSKPVRNWKQKMISTWEPKAEKKPKTEIKYVFGGK